MHCESRCLLGNSHNGRSEPLGSSLAALPLIKILNHTNKQTCYLSKSSTTQTSKLATYQNPQPHKQANLLLIKIPHHTNKQTFYLSINQNPQPHKQAKLLLMEIPSHADKQTCYSSKSSIALTSIVVTYQNL